MRVRVVNTYSGEKLTILIKITSEVANKPVELEYELLPDLKEVKEDLDRAEGAGQKLFDRSCGAHVWKYDSYSRICAC